MMSLTMYGINCDFTFFFPFYGMCTVVNVATYYSAPGDGDTIHLEAHALVSPNPMYESLDVPTRHAYEEVHDFETKAVPNGSDDVALYSYVPPTVSLVGTHTVYTCLILSVYVGIGVTTDPLCFHCRI